MENACVATNLRIFWDNDADVTLDNITGGHIHHRDIVNGMGQTIIYDINGNVVSIDLLYCSVGITLTGKPEKLHHKAECVAEALSITVLHG